MGELNAPNLAAAMLAAQGERRTGLFSVRVDQVETRIYVSFGTIVSVEQGSPEDALGRMLLREGKLTQEQYEAALKHAGQSATPMRFGEALVALRFMSGNQVFQALGEQVRQKTIRCLSYPDPQWSFEQGRRADGHFPVRAGRLILAAVKMFDVDRMRRILDLDQKRYLKLTSDAASTGLLFEATSLEQGVIDVIDGSTTTHDLIAAAERSPDKADCWAVLVALVWTGAAGLSAEPVRGLESPRDAPTPVAVRRESRTLRLGPAVSSQEGTNPSGAAIASVQLKKVQATPAKSFTPPAAFAPPAGSSAVRPPTPAVGFTPPARGSAVRPPTPAAAFTPPGGGSVVRPPTPATAFKPPTPAIGFAPPTPANGGVTPRDARLEAEEAYRKGMRLLDRGEADKALVEMERAASLSTATEFVLARDWAAFLAKPNDENRGERLAELQRMAKDAVKTDPNFAFGLFVLGRAAALAGSNPEAVRFFRKAVRLDPSLLEAERYLRLLTIRATRPQSSPDLGTAMKTPSSPKLVAAKPFFRLQPDPVTDKAIRAALGMRDNVRSVFGKLRSSIAQWGRARRKQTLTSQEQASSLPQSQPSSLQRRNARPVRLAVALAAVNVLALGVVARSSRLHPARTGSAAAKVVPGQDSQSPTMRPVASSSDSIAPAATSAKTEAVASKATAPSAAAPSAPVPLGAKRGILLTSSSAKGHRIFVDGAVVGEAPTPIVVSCGPHAVRVGSTGKDQRIEVPCGGTITLH